MTWIEIAHGDIFRHRLHGKAACFRKTPMHETHRIRNIEGSDSASQTKRRILRWRRKNYPVPDKLKTHPFGSDQLRIKIAITQQEQCQPPARLPQPATEIFSRDAADGHMILDDYARGALQSATQ
jgi:hypothetical protein